MQQAKIRVKSNLISIYGHEIGEHTWQKLDIILDDFTRKYPDLPKDVFQLSENDVILITYGDQFSSQERTKIETLQLFLEKYLEQTINTVHLLPFFPYSSDDGFSVIDYAKIDPDLGNWNQIEELGKEFSLMFDFVLNHISRSSHWFQKYLDGHLEYQNFFIEMDPSIDLSMVVRPRVSPLLTPIDTQEGKKFLWTTFSTDQIDLNYQNPIVTLNMLQTLLEYVAKGALYIRLDAIAYLWKKTGTKCIHLKETHLFVKLMRAVLDVVAPQVILVTETNVPHKENISYFGNELDPLTSDLDFPRSDEGQMVYQFSLAPLVLHSFLTGNTNKLTDWAANNPYPFSSAIFLNMIASHDGIGIRPAEGILSDTEISNLAYHTIQQGGQVSSKINSDGSESPYELNITLFDFLSNPSESLELSINRFIASQVIMLSLRGIPGIYIHSLFGSQNCYRCVEKTSRTRSINREKFRWDEFEKSFQQLTGPGRIIFERYKELLLLRKSNSAFSPFAEETIIRLDPRLFTVFRNAESDNHKVLAIVNVADETVDQIIKIFDFQFPQIDSIFDLIGKQKIPVKNGEANLVLSPYQAVWLT